MEFQGDPEAEVEEDTYEGAEEGGEEVYATSSQGSTEASSTLTWIAWFTSLPGHDFYCEVHEEFIEDDFNLTGLQSQVPFWKEALEMVLDVEPEEETIPDVAIIESSAELLYGLVHQRFILTKQGLHAMYEKYRNSAFGACPRVYCYSTPVLPCGKTETPGIDTVKLYCPNCGDIYSPPSSKYAQVDGAFFGPTFPSLFFQTYPDYLHMPFKQTSTGAAPPPPVRSSTLASSSSAASASPISHPASPAMVNPNPHGGQRTPFSEVYVPKIYGFKVSERARSGPRMGWLRERPEAHSELDKVDWKGRWVGDDSSGGPGQDDDRSTRKEESELFDDDDEDSSESEEEEEEEDAAAAGAGAANGGAGTTKEKGAGSAMEPATDTIPPLEALLALRQNDEQSRTFLPNHTAKRRRLNNGTTQSIDIIDLAQTDFPPIISDEEEIATRRSEAGSSVTTVDGSTELETPDDSNLPEAGKERVIRPLPLIRAGVTGALPTLPDKGSKVGKAILGTTGVEVDRPWYSVNYNDSLVA